jgi:hypothetical protein
LADDFRAGTVPGARAVTAQRIVHRADDRAALVAKHGGEVVDCEVAHFGRACDLASVPWFALKVITVLADAPRPPPDEAALIAASLRRAQFANLLRNAW